MNEMVKCNWCNSVCTDDKLLVVKDIEHCPECGRTGCLMDTSYLIRSTAETHTYWSNSDGWGEIATATLFTHQDSMQLSLPIEGEWVPV